MLVFRAVIAFAAITLLREAAGPRLVAAAAAEGLPRVEAMFAHDLATPTGRVALTWPQIFYDRANSELFLTADGFVRIFDASGMEIHRFGDDGSLGNVTRAVALSDGDVVVLTTLNGRRAYLRCDFRGELSAKFGLKGLPEGFSDFEPDDLVYRDGSLYFAERGRMRVVVTDPGGAYLRSYQLRDLVAATLSRDDERKPPPGMDAFNVDSHGNLLFTMSTLFAGAVVSPAGEARLFGSRGSRPGHFNIVGGITADEKGYLYVTDRLRSVVTVWDRELRPLGEFGYRGDDVWNLLTPYDIAVGNGLVYVAQAGNRGVKVFRVRVLEPPPDPPPAQEPKPGATAG
jgi:hypothetical protein